MQRFLRRFLDRFPSAALQYREIRDWRRARSAPFLPTPFGFRLAGSPLMASGVFEVEETRLLCRELDRAQLFVDVGANVGFYSCLARSRGVPTVAVEPSPHNLSLLLRNLRANGFDDVEVLPLGLAGRPGVRTLHGGGTGASLLPGWAGAAAGWERAIAVSTFDRLVLPRSSGLRTLVKLDIEGAEREALAGAVGLLSQEPAPVWLVENNLDEHHPSGRNPDFVGVFELFFAAGYRACVADATRRVLDRDGVEQRAAAGHAASHNYLFRRS